VGRAEESFLVNAAGELTSPSRLGLEVLSCPVFDRQQLNPFRGEAGTSNYRDFRGQMVMAAYRKLRSKDYYLVAQVASSDLHAPVRQLRREILLYVAPFLALGVVLAVGAWRYAVNYITKLMHELCQALQVAQERERERDLAHQELARRFEEERELSQQKAQFQAQLASYEKYAALAQLALGAAHEINNPLLGILTHLELKGKAASGEEERAEIQQCIEAAKRISATVRGLIHYARPAPLQLSKVNLDRLVGDTLAFLRHQPLFRAIQLETQIPSGLPAISADANQLSQVLMNLLLNAAEAMPEGGTITISAEKVKFADQVEIRVADTGSGIPADILPHVLEPFFTTKRGKGTGLGLSISQAYLRSHGGDIQIESFPRRGTTVRITLPIRQEGRPVPDIEEVIA
jgi:signal transduction histidine kinase